MHSHTPCTHTYHRLRVDIWNGKTTAVALRCTGHTPVVTADVAGSLSVGVSGVHGLTADDAAPVTGVVSDRAVSFASGKDLSSLVGEDIVLKMVLKSADVFTAGLLDFEHGPSSH
jgi:hypothetical protein